MQLSRVANDQLHAYLANGSESVSAQQRRGSRKWRNVAGWVVRPSPGSNDGPYTEGLAAALHLAVAQGSRAIFCQWRTSLQTPLMAGRSQHGSMIVHAGLFGGCPNVMGRNMSEPLADIWAVDDSSRNTALWPGVVVHGFWANIQHWYSERLRQVPPAGHFSGVPAGHM